MSGQRRRDSYIHTRSTHQLTQATICGTPSLPLCTFKSLIGRSTRTVHTSSTQRSNIPAAFANCPSSWNSHAVAKESLIKSQLRALKPHARLIFARRPSQHPRPYRALSLAKIVPMLSMRHSVPSSHSPHIRRRLNARHKLKRDVPQSNQRDQATRRVLPPVVTHNDAANEEIEDAAADEAEHERGVAGDLRRDLELCGFAVSDAPGLRLAGVLYQGGRLLGDTTVSRLSICAVMGFRHTQSKDDHVYADDNTLSAAVSMPCASQPSQRVRALTSQYPARTAQCRPES